MATARSASNRTFIDDGVRSYVASSQVLGSSETYLLLCVAPLAWDLRHSPR